MTAAAKVQICCNCLGIPTDLSNVCKRKSNRNLYQNPQPTFGLLCMTADQGWLRLLQLIQMLVCSCCFQFDVVEWGLEAGLLFTI